MPLVKIGLLVSIPIIIWGSQIVLKLMGRLPIIITVVGTLVGWIAGTITYSDPALKDWPPKNPGLNYGMGVAGALLVLGAGMMLKHQVQPDT